MQFLKTFANGKKCHWQIEDCKPIAYIDGVRAGVIWQCINMDDNGNTKKPQVVNGKTLVAYVKHAGSTYWFVDGEFDEPRLARDRAVADKAAADKAAWDASDAGKAEAELRRKAAAHDALYNEGGEGYNPHRADDDMTDTAYGRNRHAPDGA